MDKDPSREQTFWRICQLRTTATMSLVCFLAVAALWVFYFSELPWQALIASSLAGLLLSWSAAVLGIRRLTEQLEGEATPRRPNPKMVMDLARYGFFLGVFGFVAFFLINYS